MSKNKTQTKGQTGVTLYGLKRYFGGAVCKSRVKLHGKTVIVTGSNTGIGKETALDLAKRGARVILACRDMTKAESAAAEIRRKSGNSNVVARRLDLASLASVRIFTENIKKTEQSLHILINNAGIMACPKWETQDGFEMQFGVNHLGHFVLTNELLDLIRSSAPSRIINVSSRAHEKGEINFDDLNWEHDYNRFKAYNQSKLANVIFTKELSQRLRGSGVTAYSLHPGVVNTELMRHILGGIKAFFYAPLLWLFLKNSRQGAQTTIHCAVAEGIENYSGKYFSDCTVKNAAPQAQNDQVSKRLWDISAKLTGVSLS